MHLLFVGDVGTDTDCHVGRTDLLGGGLCLVGVEIGDHHAGTLGGQTLRDGLADTRSCPGDKRDARRQWLRFRHPGQFGLFQGPVFDPELLGLVDGAVVRDGLGAAHHVDGVEVELTGNPRGLFVLSVAEHPDPGDQHDRRIGTAHGGGAGGGVPLVVGRVVLAVRGVELLQSGDAVVHGCVGRQIEHHRLHLGAQEVIGAGGAEGCQLRMLCSRKEFEDGIGVRELTDLRIVGAHQTAQCRRQCRRLGPPLVVGQRPEPTQRRAERLRSPVAGDVLFGRPDDLQ